MIVTYMKVFCRIDKHVMREKAMWLKVRSFTLCLGNGDITSALDLVGEEFSGLT